MKWRVLVSAPYIIPFLGKFREFFIENDIEVIVADVDERLEEEALIRLLPSCHGILCGDDRITANVLDCCPDLRVIVKWGTGIDSIDAVAAAKRDVVVRRTPNAFSEPVADTVLGYVLAFCRNVTVMDSQMKNGLWDKVSGVALNECTIGVIGVGDVGRAVLRRARAFGAELLGNDIRSLDKKIVQHLGVEMVDLETLLCRADFVSINCDLNETSYRLINRQTLSSMQPHSILVNTARGEIVNEADLINALNNKVIAGAGLDVFEHEPLATDSPLRCMDNCLIAPHNSNSSPEAWDRVHVNSLNMLVEELRKE